VRKSELLVLCSDGALKTSPERPLSASQPSAGRSSPKTRHLWPRPTTWRFAARWKPRGSSSLMVMVEVRECVYAILDDRKRW